MPPTKQLLFLDASPLNAPQARQANKKKAYAYAARRTHERRKGYLKSAARALVKSNNMTTQTLPSRSPVENLIPTDNSATPLCPVCGDRLMFNYTDGDPSLSCRCSLGSANQFVDEERVGRLRSPSSHPDWAHEDISDLQFYMDVLGSSVKHYSDSAFFNVVVPCLTDFDRGIKNLVLAVASTHRDALTTDEVKHKDGANVQSLERCNRAIHYLAKQPATASQEVLQTSCVLLACLHMLQLDIKAAAAYIQAGQKLCQMDETTRSQRRFSWARNVTCPERQKNYMRSSFGNIIASTVAKSAVEFEWWSAASNEHVEARDSKDERLTIDPLVLRNPIQDIHDLLGALENIVPVHQQLMRNLSYTAAIDLDSRLAQDLLARFDQIDKFLRAAETPDARMRSAINSLLTAKCCFATGVTCQVLSGSEMDWDDHIDAFSELVSWPEQDLSSGGSEGSSPFVFLPFTSIIVKPLWFTAVHCRDPVIRRRAIALLLKHHRNESGMDSWVAGHIASTLMILEEGERSVKCPADVRDCDRVVLRGFEYDENDRQFYMLYTYAIEIELPDAVALHKHILEIKPDPRGVVRIRNAQVMLNYLNTLHVFVAQATNDNAPKGCIKPIWYDGEKVSMRLLPVEA